MHRIHLCSALFLALVCSRPANAQALLDETQPTPQPPTPYVPITGAERVRWAVTGTFGPTSLAVGGIAGLWSTGFNTPQEWGRTAKGFGKRYAAREADVALSHIIEAGLGAIDGEEPRYVPAPRGPVGSRFKYAMKMVVLTQRRDGHLAPAWARYASNTVNNVIDNVWLPPSATTARQTAIRSVNGVIGGVLGNLWEEFWPDISKRLRR